MRSTTRRTDERGTVMILAVFGVVLAMISAALAVDLGRLAQDKRFDQKAADLAALDASRDLTQACAIAQASVARNDDGIDPITLACSDPALDPAADVVIGSWSSGTFTPGAGGDAVKVTARSDFEAAFPFVGGVDGTQASAVAQALDVAGFSLGSNLASVTVDDNTTLNRVFSSLLGIPSPGMNLTAVGYQGLASGFVSLTDLVAADAGLGTPDELLASNVSVRRLAEAAVIALNNKGDAASLEAATRLGTFAANIDSSLDMQLSDVLSVQQPGAGSAVDGQINVFDLITTAGQAAQIANGVNLLTIPNLTVSIPGLTESTLKLHLIEAPRLAFGPARADVSSPTGWATWAQTAQMGIELTTRIVVEVPPVCALVCLPSALSLDLQLPIVVEAAKATASLTDVRCTGDVNTSEADILVELMPAAVGADMTLAAKALGVPVVGLTPVAADASVAGGSDPMTFVGPFPTAIQSTSANELTLAADLTADLSAFGGALNVGLASSLLAPVTALIDQRILQPLMQSLGLSIAGADVRALTVGCDLVALVG